MGTDRPFVHLSTCPKKLYNGLGDEKNLPTKKLYMRRNLVQNGQIDEKWTDGQMVPASGDSLMCMQRLE